MTRLGRILSGVLMVGTTFAATPEAQALADAAIGAAGPYGPAAVVLLGLVGTHFSGRMAQREDDRRD